ncbi:sulfur-oxidizing protein SoxA [Enhydrobacter aerosaccus]|uniref:L-cysteine S-thiosulfotransferase subunit SoxA n=2 Tax=Enhydrobacter aerosaccus TaxID=225324 RepID=A0A1T4R5G3_9HYPH|nr:sulfur oxidation c-type cytochrome SoxA [Enhydrobacter aerosaccus]SKA11310.1 sulfur-oxidizing protein SoxA [Enhydrobacter aerosaccus]
MVFLASFAAAQGGAEDRRSGYQDMGAALQKMQDDDTANPAMLFVQAGEALWKQKAGASDKACADCHAAGSMKGVAARYPAFTPGSDRPVDLDGRINLCRTTQQKAPAFGPESQELLQLSAYLALQSRGLPIAPPDDARLTPVRAEGEQLFKGRQGQLNLSCADCHDDNAGKSLGGATIPQAHPTGYPIYRLEWQTLGSLKRRLRNCMIGMRAEPFAYDAPEYVALEAYLMQRAKGMTMDAPAVRP